MTPKRPGSLPFANPVGDSFELMKKMWGFAGLPGLPGAGNLASMASRIPQQLPNMFAPTLDVNELEKRIADLRAVEQWLELNASILRTTIQSLEVQKATIATLKGISGAMMAPMLGSSGAPPKLAPDLSKQAPPEVALGLAAMNAEESNAARSAALPGARKKSRSTTRRQSATQAAAMPEPLNPAAWWNTLQDQFTKIATAASNNANPPASAAKKKSAKSRKKPTSRSALR
ncbi:MAG TPA: PhaM family polyhydroxyalkanoate granule multifunctional regulatory protein [Burkholderiaceae bacterium]|nr:PhaM family polyhydroxyalkanoate granule multifunctional regulatory protein [Burkholderiaceae bacterium]